LSPTILEGQGQQRLADVVAWRVDSAGRIRRAIVLLPQAIFLAIVALLGADGGGGLSAHQRIRTVTVRRFRAKPTLLDTVLLRGGNMHELMAPGQSELEAQPHPTGLRVECAAGVGDLDLARFRVLEASSTSGRNRYGENAGWRLHLGDGRERIELWGSRLSVAWVATIFEWREPGPG